MTRKRIFLILTSLLALVTVIFLAYLWVMPPLSHVSRLQEEQEVYPTVVGKSDVLKDRTIIGWDDFSKDYLDFIKRGLPQLEDDTLADFRERNTASFPLKDYFPTQTSYVFLTSPEIDQLYQDGWEAFDSKYPNSRGITSLSRIGFNIRYTQALLFKEYGNPAELGSDTGAYGEGNFVLLEKKNGVWIIIGEWLMWIT